MTACLNKDIKVNSLRLFQRYQKTPNTKIRNQIMELNFGLVKKEAYHWTNQCNENYDDLLQVGSIGLINMTDNTTAINKTINNIEIVEKPLFII